MEAMVPAGAYNKVWCRYERYCREKSLKPFSYVTLGIWVHDMSIHVRYPSIFPAEIEIVDNIISAARRIG